MAAVLRDTLVRIERHKTLEPHYRELLDILEEIIILRERCRARMHEGIFCVDESLIETKLSGGLPIVDIQRGLCDLSEPEAYFFELLKIAAERTSEDIQEVISAFEKGTYNYCHIVSDTFIGEEKDEGPEELVDEEDPVFDLLGFLIEESLRPALEVVAEKYGSLISEKGWTEGYCPVCGREPKIGRLTSNGEERYLFCNQCGYEWLFKVMTCPFCGNENQESLAYFLIEGEERYRVEVCNKCNRYIKTVELSDSDGSSSLDVEDITTLHLDILANDEGYN